MNVKAADAANLSDIVASIDRAIEHDRVVKLAAAMAQLEAAGALADPAFFAPERPDRYSRRLIWRDPADRFVVVGMTWGPGQFAQLHDHNGLWGVEIVAGGTMLATAYRLVDRDANDRHRFIREYEGTVTKGAVGAIVPPLEYHAFGNPRTSGVSHTVHVYGGAFERCRSFTHDADGWWTAQPVVLSYDE